MLGLLAAAAHDVDHPGVNQPFLIKTNHHLANLYQVKEKKILKMTKLDGVPAALGTQFEPSCPKRWPSLKVSLSDRTTSKHLGLI